MGVKSGVVLPEPTGRSSGESTRPKSGTEPQTSGKIARGGLSYTMLAELPPGRLRVASKEKKKAPLFVRRSCIPVLAILDALTQCGSLSQGGIPTAAGAS